MEPRRKPRRLPTSWVVSLASGLSVAILWEAIVYIGAIPEVYLAPPSELFVALIQLLRHEYGTISLWYQIWRSVTRVFSGYILAAALAIPLGLLMGRSLFIQRVVDPILHTYRPIPPIAYIPLLIIWFGIGELPKIVLIFLTVFPVVALNTFDGAKNVPETKTLAAYSLGANERQIFLYIVLPGSLPYIATGLRIGIGSAWIAVVAAEMIAADSGIGWMVLDASRYLRTDIVIVGILIIGLIGFSLDQGFRSLENKVVPWRGKG